MDASSAAPSATSNDASTPAVAHTPWAATHRETARAIADFLVRQQNPDGALPDYADGDAANEDSNMEYALLGLAAAYAVFHEAVYLHGLESGIRWLAAREELHDESWRGSFRYQYSTVAPYAPIVTSPGVGVRDVRGVDTTSALFVYLLAVHARVSGSRALADELAAPAQAALDFVLTKDRADGDPFTYSSWQMPEGSTTWQRYAYQYSADQGDVYLGLRAGAELYQSKANGRYAQAAQAIESQLGGAFFLPNAGRFAVGRAGPGDPDPSFDGFNGVFAQGYLGWVFGGTEQTERSYKWLQSKVTPDGSLVCFDDDPRYTLSASTLVMAAHRLGEAEPTQTLAWLAKQAVSGQVRDSAEPSSSVLSNCAGFALMALLGFDPF